MPVPSRVPSLLVVVVSLVPSPAPSLLVLVASLVPLLLVVLSRLPDQAGAWDRAIATDDLAQEVLLPFAERH